MSDNAATMDPTVQAPRGCPVAHNFNPAVTSAHPDPFPWYKEVRETGRVVYVPGFDWYVVTRAEEIEEVLAQPVTFSNIDSLGTTKPIPAEVYADTGDDWDPHIELFLTLNDPPVHTRMRKLMAPAFTPRRVAAYREVIRDIANARIDDFAATKKADVGTDFAFKIPNEIIAQITGAGADAAEDFVRWTDAFLRVRFLDRPDEEAAPDWRLVHDQEQYTRGLVRQRREAPENDLTTDLINARGEDGENALTEDEVVSNIFSFFGAGSETAAITMVHTLYLLLTHPGQWEEVKADPSLLPAAIEESLRLRSPVRGLVRVATEDAEIGGVPIPKDARVYLQIASGNHDEEVYEDPEKFDIHRSMDTVHFSFGRGTHFCVGAPVARLEVRVALETLIERLPNLRLAPEQGELEYADNPVLPGVKSLVLEWD